MYLLYYDVCTRLSTRWKTSKTHASFYTIIGAHNNIKEPDSIIHIIIIIIIIVLVRENVLRQTAAPPAVHMKTSMTLIKMKINKYIMAIMRMEKEKKRVKYALNRQTFVLHG